MTQINPLSLDDDDIPNSEATGKNQTTRPGGQQEVKWHVVAETAGLTPATIMAGRLQAEGIPVRVWQEGAGQALGLTVGRLGTGYVAVPTEYEAEARAILETDESDLLDDWDEDDEDDEEQG
jgi:hypothetical protein